MPLAGRESRAAQWHSTSSARCELPDPVARASPHPGWRTAHRVKRFPARAPEPAPKPHAVAGRLKVDAGSAHDVQTARPCPTFLPHDVCVWLDPFDANRMRRCRAPSDGETAHSPERPFQPDGFRALLGT